MADVQLERGYVRIANRLLEAMLHAPFTATHLKIVGGIVRLTYGWRQKTVRISKAALARAIGLVPSGGFRRAFDELLEQGVVVELEHARGRGAGVYFINKNHEKWGRFAVDDAELKRYWDVRPRRQHYGGHACYVYYARAGDAVKIGLSRDPWLRVRNLAIARPGLVLVGLESGATLVERERHREFAAFRVESEWFRWCPAIEEHIKKGGLDANLERPSNRPKEGAFEAPPNRPQKGDMKTNKKIISPPQRRHIAPVESSDCLTKGDMTCSNNSPNNELQPPTNIERKEKQTAASSSTRTEEAANPKPEQVAAPDEDRHARIQEYARKLTSALNNAISATWGEQPLVVQPVKALNTAEALLAAGVPLEFARELIAARVPTLSEKPNSVKYFERAILERFADRRQRAQDAADPSPSVSPNGNAEPRGRGREPTSTTSVLANVTGAAERTAREQRARSAYEVARQRAVDKWAKAPEHDLEYRAILLTANSHYGTMLDTPWARRGRDSEVVTACAERAGVPPFEQWLAAQAQAPPEEPEPRPGADGVTDPEP